VAVGGGGFASGPVVAVAAASGVPGLALEADAHLGVANKLLRPFVRCFCLSFPIEGLRPPRYVVTGRPLSPHQLDATAEKGREAFGLVPDLPVVLAFGGSQGARSINRACVDAFGGGDLGFQLVHVCGPKNEEQVRADLAACGERFERYHLVPYTDRLAAAMAAADLVVARSGGSVAELAALGRPAILVPYPYATADHQRKNARELVTGGGAVLVDDAELNGEVLARLVSELLGDPSRLAAMAAASAALGRPDAALRVADQIEDILTARRGRGAR
jgi:UDP-N-acetylglucosamine--N-acetylmuramyl-(pentapeptide) pyrophosphoryl-undecaprenol N-acetylglucosamine transferase